MPFNMATIAVGEKNCKGQLIEFCLKNNKPSPKFEISDQTGPPHNPVFVCSVFIDNTLVAKVEDKNKKSAENTAAKLALQALGMQDNPVQLDYVALLHEFSQGTTISMFQRFNFVSMSREGPDHTPEFTMRVEMKGKIFPTSSAKRNKKQAKKEAAYLALQEIRKEFPHEIPELPDVFIDESGSQNSSLSESAGGEFSGNRSFSENGFSDSGSATSECQYRQDPVALLNLFCQKNKWLPEFEDSGRSGPSHNLQMSCKVKIGTRYFPESSMRKTKKQAKKEAAFLALKELKGEFPQDIPDLTEVFTDEAETRHSSVSSHMNSDHIKPSSESGLHSSTTSNSECQYWQDPVALLNLFCQKKKLLPEFEDSGRSGPSHNLQMSCKVKIGTRYFPESSMRKTKKQAKKEAALLALKELKGEFPQDIPDLTKVFIDESETRHSSASSHMNSDPFKPSSESGLHRSTTSNSELTPQSSGLTPSNLQRKNLNIGLNQPTTDSGGGSLLSPSARSSSNDLSRAQSPLAQFDNIDKLDKGAFGQVVKARKILDDKFYAVKIVQVRDNKVLQEVTTLARLEHPNIVRYYNAWLGVDDFCDGSESSYSSSSDFSRTGTCLYIQMELCEGGSLKRWIRKRNSQNNINKSESLDIFRQIIEGVSYIHSQKLIHRDLKPGNILFTKNMIVKIGDFGLVTRMTGEEEKKALERTRGTGTRSYMAPEQKDNKYENEVDIYPLGLILFELLWIFHSDHEKAKHWPDVRQGIYPSGFEEQHPLEKPYISKMLSHDHKERPLAEDLARSFQKRKILNSQTH
ncbi:interferon-induced, double-stranded RNA-activated protein kinase-like isoform X2 [Hyla sarda]|uniref:interferon-induced, double-stranded RNA-activated protein kinase-like isoform X2 n=1 Tax=Hyla sarda TaxID=327740 RepID=UPI0024C2836D|nr:interferon-induced, double-stranded RNA-activated protein kinase-like isoform X2 [Hyla sarda]